MIREARQTIRLDQGVVSGDLEAVTPDDADHYVVIKKKSNETQEE